MRFFFEVSAFFFFLISTIFLCFFLRFVFVFCVWVCGMMGTSPPANTMDLFNYVPPFSNKTFPVKGLPACQPAWAWPDFVLGLS